MTDLPKWITQVGPNQFEVDPDRIYPELQKQLGIKELTQYGLEIMQGCMKLDFDLAVRMAGAVDSERAIERRIKADGKRKEKWAVEGKPKGEKDWAELSLGERQREITGAYRRIRGFVPNA